MPANKIKTNLKFSTILGACFAVLAMAMPLAARADVIIDSFDDQQGPFSAGNSNSLGVLTQSFEHVVGGRGMMLPPGTNINIGVTDGSTMLDFKGTGGVFSLGYGGSTGLMPWVPSPMELSVDPATEYLQLTFLDYNHAGGQDMILDTYLQKELAEGIDPQPIVTTFSSAGPQIIDVPLASLGGKTLDFVTFEFHAPTGTEFQLDSVALITNVPEPSALTIYSLALVVLLKRQKSRP